MRKIVYNIADFLLFKSWIDGKECVAYDVETTGLNVRKDKVIGFGVSDSNSAFYFPILKNENGALVKVLNDSIIENCYKLLANKKLITWNGSYDLRITKNNLNIDLINSLWSDGMLAKHTCDEEMPFALKKVAEKEFGTSAIQEQQDLFDSIKTNGGEGKEVYKADLDIIAKYCMQDCILTFKLNSLFLQRLESQNLLNFFLVEEVMPLYREVTIPMELKGLKLDMPFLEQTRSEIRADIAIIDQQIREKIQPHCSVFESWFLNKEYPVKRTGPFVQALAELENVNLPKTDGGKFSLATKHLDKLEDCLFKRFMSGSERLSDNIIKKVQLKIHGNEPMLNLQSKHHLKKIFFDELGEVPLSLTDTGLPQLDDDFLHGIQDKYDFVPLLLTYNKLCKISSTYVDRFLDEQEDGIYYPDYNQHRTTSGRYSGGAQQLSRPIEEGKAPEIIRKYNNRIRQFFISGNGSKFVGADYTSLEVVVFADDAGDEALLEMIRKKYDFYSQIAIGAWGLHQYSADKKSPMFLKDHLPSKRQDSKSFSLGLRYGMGSYKLSKVLDIPESEAKQIMQNYFNSYPKLKLRMNELISSAKQHGFVRSKAGRVRHLPLLKELWNTHGSILEDGLKLYEKYGDSPSKYGSMKDAKTKYWGMVNNALNFPIQSMAASIVNRASIAISRAFKDNNLNAYICMNVHDEINCICPDNEVELVRSIMQNCMENTTKLSVPLTAEPNVSERYSELK